MVRAPFFQEKPVSAPATASQIVITLPDGKTLTFQVSHRRAHPPESLNDGPVSFQLKLTGPDKGELVNEDERDPNAPVFVLTKSEY